MDSNARRNLNPHREARLAMLVWGAEYSRQNGGSMDFYDRLTPSRKRLLREWCDELERTARAQQERSEQADDETLPAGERRGG